MDAGAATQHPALGSALMGLFSKATVPVMGIDISGTSIKVLEVGVRGDAFRVEAYGSAPMPPDSYSESNITNTEAVGEAISKAVRKSGSRLKHVAVAVSGAPVITRILQVPATLSEQDLEAMVEQQADQHIPFPLDEVALDFEVQGPSANDPEQLDVLVAASRLDNLESREEALEFAGLIPKIIDVESFALENVVAMMMEEEYGEAGLEQEGEGQVVAIADIGSAITVFSVLQNMNTVYSREEAFGGSQLTERIQQTFGLSYEEADMAKREGGLPDNYASDVLEPFTHAISQQLSRALQFFYSSSNITSVDYLLLAGGSAAIPGLSELVESQLSVPAAMANPFARMSTASRVSAQQLQNDAPALMVCCGLALRSFD